MVHAVLFINNWVAKEVTLALPAFHCQKLLSNKPQFSLYKDQPSWMNKFTVFTVNIFD